MQKKWIKSIGIGIGIGLAVYVAGVLKEYEERIEAERERAMFGTGQ